MTDTGDQIENQNRIYPCPRCAELEESLKDRHDVYQIAENLIILKSKQLERVQADRDRLRAALERLTDYFDSNIPSFAKKYPGHSLATAIEEGKNALTRPAPPPSSREET